MAFDPYLVWLDISPHERPVNYYRLFGLRPLETDPALISAAADRVIAHVSQFQNSSNSVACQQLLGELSAARACLLDPLRKRAYDQGFSSPASIERSISAPPVPGTPNRPSVTAAGSGKPAWLAGKTLPQTQRSGERQISASPPLPPTAPNNSVSMPGASRTSATQPYVPSQPVAKSVPISNPGTLHGHNAPLQPAHPSGAIPFGTAPTAKPPTVAIPSQPPPYSPIQPVAASASAASPATPPAPTPPAWAAAERTGQQGRIVAGDAAEPQTIHEPPRRIVRRHSNNTAVYVVVALAMAMIVFFFGAILLLALFVASR